MKGFCRYTHRVTYLRHVAESVVFFLLQLKHSFAHSCLCSGCESHVEKIIPSRWMELYRSYVCSAFIQIQRERSKCLGSGDLIIRHFFTLCKQGGGTDTMITCLIAPIPSGDTHIHITLLHCLIAAKACDA